MPAVIELHRCRQQGLEPDGTARGLLVGQALLFLVLWRVEGAQRVDQPLGQRRDHGHPVILGPERRRELEEGAVVADIELVQRQVMDRYAGRNRQPRGLGPPERRQRDGRGKLVGVIAHARRLDERQVALQPDALGNRRDRRQAELACELPARHAGALGEARILRMADHQRAEAAGIREAALEDPGALDGVDVGEGDGAGIEQEADLGHLPARAPLGECCHRQDADRSCLDRAALEEFELLGRVDRRQGVGPGHDRRDAARGCGCAGGAETLLVPLAGLAHLDPDVDDPGRQTAAAAVDAGPAPLEDLGDLAAQDHDAAHQDAVALRVDHTGIRQGQHPTGPSASLRARRFRASRSIAAMRTATPISTCS